MPRTDEYLLNALTDQHSWGRKYRAALAVALEERAHPGERTTPLQLHSTTHDGTMPPMRAAFMQYLEPSSPAVLEAFDQFAAKWPMLAAFYERLIQRIAQGEVSADDMRAFAVDEGIHLSTLYRRIERAETRIGSHLLLVAARKSARAKTPPPTHIYLSNMRGCL